MNLADMGLQSAGFHVGFVAPTLIYSKMRQLQASAAALDADIAANVQRQAFKDAWTEWYKRWRQLYDKYQPDDPWAATAAKLAAAGYSDELNADVESYRKQFSGFFDGYRVETGGKVPSGQPVPAPPVPSAPSQEEGVTTIAWWKIALVGVGVLAVGGLVYSVYRNVQLQKQRQAAFVDRLPQLLPGGLGEAAREAHASRDCLGLHVPSHAPGCPHAMHAGGGLP